MFFAPRITLTEGLTDPTVGLIMGSTAEVLARDFGDLAPGGGRLRAPEPPARQDRARLGAASPTRDPPAPAARGEASKQGALVHDDGIRDDQTPQSLAKLKPYFEKPDGIVTVGNACGITDGATALLVASEDRARSLGLQPLAAIKSHAWAGCDPARMGIGPVYASSKALSSAGVELGDVGVVELNEAFAAQVIACARAFESDGFAREHLGRSGALGELAPDKLNVNGGAIALGHPVGATGARLLLTTAHEMAVSDHELGLATLCIGGGQGGAVLLERTGS